MEFVSNVEKVSVIAQRDRDVMERIVHVDLKKMNNWKQQLLELSIKNTGMKPGKWLEEFIEEVRKESINKYKPVLDSYYATSWLRGTYGLDDGDTLNAGEVEELLETFISDHAAKDIVKT